MHNFIKIFFKRAWILIFIPIAIVLFSVGCCLDLFLSIIKTIQDFFVEDFMYNLNDIIDAFKKAWRNV